MTYQQPAFDTNPGQARRLALLLATLDQWLQSGGSEASVRRALLREVEPAVALWLAGHGCEWRSDSPDRLAQCLAADRSLPAWPRAPTPAALATAMARACLAQANGEVESEARRAGHGETFEALRPYLQTDLPAGTARQLGETLGLAEGALQTALKRLRRRFRQRVESGLALWSSTPEQRQALRRRLHSALTEKESSP